MQSNLKIFLLSLLVFSLLAASIELIRSSIYNSEMEKRSTHFSDGRFVNDKRNEETIYRIIKLIFTMKPGEWPDWIENTATPSLERGEETATLTFLSHASFYYEIDGKSILIDPVFGRAGPFNLAGPKRRRAPALGVDEIPRLDIILITHNHFDHLDLPNLRRLEKKFSPLIITALGNAKWLENKGMKSVVELDWWQSHKIDSCLTIHFVPAQHASGRGIMDRNKSFWGGFVVDSPRHVLFHSGDSGYAGHFKAIGQNFDINTALIAVGDYKPKWFMEYVHLDPKQALQAYSDLGEPLTIPMGAETFRLSAVDYGEPQKELRKLMENPPADIAAGFNRPPNIAFLEVGESYEIPLEGAACTAKGLHLANKDSPAR